MPKRRTRLPSDLPTAQVHNALRRLGFRLQREGTKHSCFVDPDDRSRVLVIPRHSKVKKALLEGELRSAGISEADFMAQF